MATITKKKLIGYLIAAMLGALLAMAPFAHAGFLPLPSSSDLSVPAPEGDTAVEQVENILGPIGRTLRIIIGAIAVLMIVLAGFTMVVKGDSEDEVNTQKTAITYGIVGLLMISIAGPIAEVFDFRQGNILADPESIVQRAALFDDTTKVVITFVKYFLGSLAALMFITNGAKMVAGSYSEEQITSAKKSMYVSALGLLMVVMSDLVVRRILFDAEYNDNTSQTVVAINQNELITQLVGMTNIVITFVGPVLMLILLVGAILYVTAGGDEEKTNTAKKIMLNSVIGIVIIYGAFALVSTVISGSF